MYKDNLTEKFFLVPEINYVTLYIISFINESEVTQRQKGCGCGLTDIQG